MTYACINRPPLRTSHPVQDGFFMDGHTRYPRMVAMADPMTKSCQYSRDDRYSDPQCAPCTNNAKAQMGETVS